MQVLVDTNIWSLVLRRSKATLSDADKKLVQALTDLINDARVQLIGMIRQELLSGIRDPAQFERIRLFLRAYRDEPLATQDYEGAARLSNLCRARGISGSGADFLICAVAIDRGWQVFSLDADFQRYAEAIPVKLYRH